MKHRGREHTTLTETAAAVVRVLERIPGVKMIAPGEIRVNGKKSGGRFITVVYTTAGFELIISGQSVQKVAVHTVLPAAEIITYLKAHKKMTAFTFKERERKPGI